MDLRGEMRSSVRNYRSRNLMSTGHLILFTKAKHSRMWWTGHVAGVRKTNAYKIALKKFAERYPCRRPI